MTFRKLLREVRVRLCLSPATTAQVRTPDNPGSGPQKLAMLAQGLRFAEKAGEAAGIPYLKGAVGLAIEVVECVEGYRTNNEELTQLALSCSTLVKDIVDLVNGAGGDLSTSMQKLVEDLRGTLQKIVQAARAIVDSGNPARRFLAHKDNTYRIDRLAREDDVYSPSSIVLKEYFADGAGWIAFSGKIGEGGENLIIKRYVHPDASTRRAMHEADTRTFKRHWFVYISTFMTMVADICSRHANLLQYKGRSRLGTDQPYNLLRGITSDRVADYIALKFAENNHQGSCEALKLLKDLTNALAYIVGTTDSSPLNISNVHLNESGHVVVVDLEPKLVVNKQSKNDMPHWRGWQEICIELLTGDPAYEPNPAIEYSADPSSRQRLEFLRPILGHIHYGGVRFKETSIEMAFKSEGPVLHQALRELRNMRRSTKLHYTAHFREPLDVDVGDIGYITGDPPQFIRLANVRSRIGDKWTDEPRVIEPLRFLPADQWATTVVSGVIRYVLAEYVSSLSPYLIPA
ncbi:hypothetical protein B0H15DRAFT_175232 [Mycena belliarum]|uniref:Uncharacterized protein n=1 Tax=Mycena belliarum TaxID=1033014 RepID=A0AAD6XTZ1_9AGAR|nr:hypothetical protein B0H15DRAFT_175232 [Mycena belliae]